jgi:hypothetical protein
MVEIRDPKSEGSPKSEIRIRLCETGWLLDGRNQAHDFEEEDENEEEKLRSLLDLREGNRMVRW